MAPEVIAIADTHWIVREFARSGIRGNTADIFASQTCLCGLSVSVIICVCEPPRHETRTYSYNPATQDQCREADCEGHDGHPFNNNTCDCIGSRRACHVHYPPGHPVPPDTPVDRIRALCTAID